MLKKMLGKKKSDSGSDSSSDEEEEKEQKKEKRSSLANIKAKFETSPKEKTSGITTKLVRPRTGSSSDEDRKKRASVPMMSKEQKNREGFTQYQLQKQNFKWSSSVEGYLEVDCLVNNKPTTVSVDIAAAAGGTVWISSSSNGSLNTIDLSTPASRSRNSSFHSMDSHQTMDLPNINENPNAPAILSFTVHKALKLEKKGMFGKADPYVLIKLGDQKFKSKTISNNQNPEWEFNTKLDFHGDTNQMIQIEVFDDDLGKDDLLGVTSIPVLDIIQNKGYINKMLHLEQCKTGDLLISVQYSPILPPRTPTPKSVSRNSSIKSIESSKETITIVQSSPMIIPGTLTLTVHKARKLEKKGMFGKADPYALISLGKLKSRTKTINNNQNPDWEFETKFDVDNSSPRKILIDIFDEDTGKDDILGTTTLDLDEIVKQRSLLNQWYPLEKCKSGEVLLSVFYKPSTPSRSSSIKSRESLKSNGYTQPIAGMLSINVLKAKKLEKSGLFGKVDPYVLLKLGEVKRMSMPVKNNHDPEWNFNAKFDIDRNAPKHIMLEVYDDDLGKDDLLGTANIELRQILETDNFGTHWYPLQNCKSGEVLLSANFTPSHLVNAHQEKIVLNMHEVSSDSSSDSDTDDEQKSNMRSLNNKLISYIDKVRLIQQANDTWKGIPPTDDRSGEIQMLKDKYEAELGNWKNKYQTSLSDAATAKMLANNVGKQNLDLTEKLKEKDRLLNERTSTIATLEEEIAELLGKLNLLQNENDRMKENEMILQKEINLLQMSLQEARDGLDKERVISSELDAKFEVIEKELQFRIHVLEEQLAEERKISKLDFSSMDFKLKSEYEKRLRSELKKLRKKYQQETNKSKQEFMHIHSKKISELQSTLSTERSTNSSAKEELKSCQERLNDLRRNIGELESINLQLTQRANQLADNLAEEGSAFRSQINGKEKEIEIMKEEINHQRQEYENILEVKLALDTEIAVYKSLIDAEEKRISRGELLANGISVRRESLDGSDREDSIVVTGKNVNIESDSSSEGENDDSGFLEKMKDKVSDAIGV